MILILPLVKLGIISTPLKHEMLRRIQLSTYGRSGFDTGRMRKIPKPCAKKVKGPSHINVKTAISFLKKNKDDIIKTVIKQSGKATLSTVTSFVFPQVAPMIWGTSILDDQAEMIVAELVKKIFDIS